MSNETDDPDDPAPNGANTPAIGSSDQGPGKSSHKKRRKHRNGHAPVAPAAAPRPIDPPEAPAEAAPDEPTETAAEPPASSTEAEATPKLPTQAPQEPPEPSPQEAAEPQPHAADDLRLRMKVWSDPRTGLRYLMPTAFMRDVVNGQPVSNIMRAYAMRDDDTKLVTLTASEWNALPFFYFRQDGPAPRATARPVDVIS